MNINRTVIWSPKLFLIFLFITSLALRLLLFFSFTCHGTNAWIPFDSEQYYQLVCNICSGNGFCFEPGAPQAYRLPGYALSLAPFYYLFGFRVALVIQLCLVSFIPVLIFYLARILFPLQNSVAIIAACTACIHPGLVLYAGMFATESLTLLMLLCFFILFFNDIQQRSWLALLAGAFLGFASLLRPIGHYVLVLAIGIIFFAQKHVLIKKMMTSAWMIVGWIGVVGPWLARNYLLYGAFFFHTLPGLHFLQYVAAPIIVQRDQCSYVQARAHVLNEWQKCIDTKENEKHCSLNDYEKCCLGQTLATRYVVCYPWFGVKHACTEMFKTCVGLYSAIILLADGATWPAYTVSTTWWTKIKRFLTPQVRRPFLIPFIYLDIIVTLLTLLGFCLFGLCALWNPSVRLPACIMTLFVALFIALTLAYGGARLRMPAEPFLLIGATYGWLWFGSKIITTKANS